MAKLFTLTRGNEHSQNGISDGHDYLPGAEITDLKEGNSLKGARSQ